MIKICERAAVLLLIRSMDKVFSGQMPISSFQGRGSEMSVPLSTYC